MMCLKSIDFNNINDFEYISYERMSFAQKKEMISESINKIHNNLYFEMLAVYYDNLVIGFMNLYAHAKHIISCGPTIKSEFQGKGLGFRAETLALNHAKEKGFTIAVGYVDESNTASCALHEKLGFELDRKYTNVQNKTMRIYIKSL